MPIVVLSVFQAFKNISTEHIKNKALTFYQGFWGNQWGSNPRPSEPQSDALTS